MHAMLAHLCRQTNIHATSVANTASVYVRSGEPCWDGNQIQSGNHSAAAGGCSVSADRPQRAVQMRATRHSAAITDVFNRPCPWPPALGCHSANPGRFSCDDRSRRRSQWRLGIDRQHYNCCRGTFRRMQLGPWLRLWQPHARQHLAVSGGGGCCGTSSGLD